MRMEPVFREVINQEKRPSARKRSSCSREKALVKMCMTEERSIISLGRSCLQMRSREYLDSGLEGIEREEHDINSEAC